MTKNQQYTYTPGGWQKQRSYGFLHLLFDLFMTAITGGLWLIYLLIRFLRTN